jgi:hypothetical protein
MAVRAIVVLTVGAAMMSQTPADIPPNRPKAAAITRREWIQIPVDTFFLAEMEAARREPPKEADRVILIQRATQAILGRAATADEVKAFVESPTKRIYEKTLDRLLEAPESDLRLASLRALVRKDRPASARDVVRGLWRLMTGTALENTAALEWYAAELLDPTLVNCCELDKPLPQAWDVKPLAKAIAVSAMFRCLPAER